MFNNIEYSFYFIILIYWFYCQFFESVTNTNKDSAFIRSPKTEILIQIFVLVLRLINYAKQYEEKKLNFVWPPLRCIRHASVETCSQPEYLARCPQQPGSVQPRVLEGCLCCSIHERCPTRRSRSGSNPVTQQATPCVAHSHLRGNPWHVAHGVLEHCHLGTQSFSPLANGSILVSRTCMYWYWSMFPSSTWSAACLYSRQYTLIEKSIVSLSAYWNTTILMIQTKYGFVTEHKMWPVTITPVQLRTAAHK